MKRESTVLSKRNAAEASNLESARIILADPERYSGIQALWARSVLEKASDVQSGSENRTTGLQASGNRTKT